MQSSAILIGGEPGIGKSTLMLQLAASVQKKQPILYVSGEESPGQIKLRAERLGTNPEKIQLLCTSSLEEVLKTAANLKPSAVVVDSIQTVFSAEAGNVPGTVNQIKYCGHELTSLARDISCPVFLVAHVTKEGSIAGPKVLEHMVDTVLMFESTETEIRVLRAMKNRFGSTDEIGLFAMKQNGLQQIQNPSEYFLVLRKEGLPPGTAVCSVYEGSRCILVEIQALTVPAKGAVSRIFSDKIDSARVSRTAAVLEKHLSLRFSDQDVYVNVAGGIRIKEVGVELALAMALYSARTGLPLKEGTALAGEITLAGEVRPITGLVKRTSAAQEMGFQAFIGPAPREEKPEIPYKSVGKIQEAVKHAFAAKES